MKGSMLMFDVALLRCDVEDVVCSSVVVVEVVGAHGVLRRASET